jgi:hypothetical protein
MLRFHLERGDDRMKHCQKMKRRQQAHLSSMKSVTRRDDVNHRIGGTVEG